MTVGILLVGGMGTRLMPLTRDTPKPMLPLAGLPVTEHQLITAKKAGVTTIVLATSYLSEVFTPYFGDGSQWGLDIRYAVEQTPLGTGGAIKNAAEVLNLSASSDEPIVIFNGDVLSSHNLSKQIQEHVAHNADVTLHLTHVDDARAADRGAADHHAGVVVDDGADADCARATRCAAHRGQRTIALRVGDEHQQAALVGDVQRVQPQRRGPLGAGPSGCHCTVTVCSSAAQGSRSSTWGVPSTRYSARSVASFFTAMPAAQPSRGARGEGRGSMR